MVCGNRPVFGPPDPRRGPPGASHRGVAPGRAARVANPAELLKRGPLGTRAANDSLDRAVDLGDVGSTSEVLTHGSIGRGSEGAADVEWYSFRLDRPGRVTATLGRPPVGSSFRGALSLYNNDTDYTDPFNPHGHRRLDQAVAAAADGVATLDRVLSPGTYSLAVSGAGNLAFHPLVAGSGLPGGTGDFELRLDVADAGPAPGD
ncbi:MAG: hypothetical protein WKF75_11000, partial [Singulisphaera sp.]